MPLKGVTDFRHTTLVDQLRANLITFFDWELLNIGAFGTVRYASSRSRLRPAVEDQNFISGKVWEAFRADWVWEDSLNYTVQPVEVSGVKVNNTFYPTDVTGTYAHKIDYPNGRVIFNSAIATGSTVQVEYSYRYINFEPSDVPWFREFLFNSYRGDNTTFLKPGEGAWAITGPNRVQLPAVIVEVSPRRSQRGLQLGGGQWVEQDILFHIFTENISDRDKLIDYIAYQKDKTILSYNKNLMAAANEFPLDEYGSKRFGAKTYPELVSPTGESGFFWKKIFIKNMVSQESPSFPPLYRAVIRGTFEIDMPEI